MISVHLHARQLRDSLCFRAAMRPALQERAFERQLAASSIDLTSASDREKRRFGAFQLNWAVAEYLLSGLVEVAAVTWLETNVDDEAACGISGSVLPQVFRSPSGTPERDIERTKK